ncbi:Rapid alkalinization factor [Euphorbia peplus]|nr:Rapid alkalinization factor [Euphorbia peplus]
MANSSALLFFTFCFCSLLSAIIISSSPVDQTLMQWFPRRSQCHGTVAECTEEDEFGMESETSRRILATATYISYDALKRGSTPCSWRGASYYNCQAGAEANPYSRGCSKIARCRSN